MGRICTSNTFITLYTMACCQVFYFIFFFEAFKEYGENFIHDDEYLSLIGAIGMICNSVARFIGPTLLDHYDFIKIYKIVWFIITFQILTISLMVKTPVLYLISNICIFASEGAFVAMLPVVTLKIFGMKRGPTIYSYL